MLNVMNGACIRGRVVDSTGDPIAGVPLEIQGVDDGRVVTGDDGTFEWVVRLGTEFEVVCFRSPWGVARTGTLGPVQGDEFQVGDVVMRGPASIEGSVSDSTGSPVEGSRIVAWDPSVTDPDGVSFLSSEGSHPGGLVLAEGTTDRSGRFVIGGLRPGSYMLALARAVAAETAVMVDLNRVHLATAQLTDESPRLRLNVRDAAGQPLRGAQFSASIRVRGSWLAFDYGTIDSSDATAVVRTQAGKAYRIVVAVPGFDFAERVLPPSTDRLREIMFVLDPKATSRHTVSVSADGQGPLANCRVSLLSMKTGGAIPGSSGTPAAKPGTYVVELPKGRCVLRILPPASEHWLLPAMREVTRDDSITPRQVTLAAGGRLSVLFAGADARSQVWNKYDQIEVFDAAGTRAAAETRLGVRPSGRRATSSPIVLGRLLPAGAYSVEARRPDGERSRWSAWIEAGEEVFITIR